MQGCFFVPYITETTLLFSALMGLFHKKLENCIKKYIIELMNYKGVFMENELINLKTYPVKSVLAQLLKDKTTKRNIIYATDNYAEYGPEYTEKSEITCSQLSCFRTSIIQPRVAKSQEEQLQRTRQKAEVFTPSWICNKMNNHCDEDWFGVPNTFNIEQGEKWKIRKAKVKFPKGTTWKDYVCSNRLEITCGEAPYIVSRYDAATGEYIEPKNRIGILDRKLRVINENTETEEEWLTWVTKAFQSVYGFEYQGDNLLVARINLICTFSEYLNDRWHRSATAAELRKIANIITWNFWQMDGISNTIPYGKPEEAIHQLSMFDFVANENENTIPETPICRIYDWKANKSILYTDLKKGQNNEV